MSSLLRVTASPTLSASSRIRWYFVAATPGQIIAFADIEFLCAAILLISCERYSAFSAATIA